MLRDLPRSTDPRALVGHETSDDAAVYAVTDELAIVETVDFFTPVVDDPYWFGRIAAANAFSDVWAMGAKPIFALNLVGFPISKLPKDVLAAILRGGADTAREAGAPILGGHSIDDPEPKYGMAVTGTVHPARVLRNVGARPGDRLLLTKPLGSGIATTAIKRQVASPALVERVTELMARLNRTAGEVLAASGGVNALTDVTGFGLLGHAWEMAQGSGVRLRLHAAAIPFLDEVMDLARKDVAPGGTRANLAWVEPHVVFDSALDAATRLALADAQTNGGLLAAVRGERASELVDLLRKEGVFVAEIGEALEAGGEPRLDVVSR